MISNPHWARTACAWIASFLGLWLLAVAWEEGQRVSTRSLLSLTPLKDALRGHGELLLTHISIPHALAAAALFLLIPLCGRQWNTLLRAMAYVVLAGGGAQVWKALLPRPDYGFYPTENSLPSGHMAITAAIAGLIVIVAGGKIWGRVIASTLVILVSLSILLTQTHVLADILASLIWSAAALALCMPHLAPPAPGRFTGALMLIITLAMFILAVPGVSGARQVLLATVQIVAIILLSIRIFFAHAPTRS